MNKWMKTQLTGINRGSWAKEEDERLKDILKVYGAKNWTRIALVFNSGTSGKGRSRKQCKLHYENTSITSR
jgi:hypothetical protein